MADAPVAAIASPASIEINPRIVVALFPVCSMDRHAGMPRSQPAFRFILI